MPKFKIALAKDAAKYYEKVDNKTAQRINKALDLIAEDPFNANGVSSIKSMPGKFRYRVGGLRILYGINQDRDLIEIYAIVPRGKAYKKGS